MTDDVRVTFQTAPAVELAVRRGELKARKLTAQRNAAEQERDQALMAFDHCHQALEEIAAGTPTPQLLAQECLDDLDGDLTSFIALVNIARRMLDMNYPADVFTGRSLDSGAQFVSTLREALDCVHGRRDV